MQNAQNFFGPEHAYDFSVVETARPEGLLSRVKKWVDDYKEECRNLDFEVEPLLDFPRDI